MYLFRFCLLWIIPLLSIIKGECLFETNTKTIRCEDTSINDYIYDVYKLDIDFTSSLLITRSYFPQIENLQNPFRNSESVDTLKISYSGVKNISEQALDDFSYLICLDLSHNELETLVLSETVRSQLTFLDVSHNKIYKAVIGRYSSQINVDFGFNRIEEIQLIATSYISTLNLEHNPIKTISNCTSPYYYTSVENLILSGIKMTSTLLDNIRCIFHTSNLNMSNSLLPIDARFNISENIVDLSNSSIRYLNNLNIKIPSMKLMNLSHNSLIALPSYVFRSLSINNLDLSHGNLTNLDYLFDNTDVYILNLSHNHLQLIESHYMTIRYVRTLDLSYNPLKLTYNSFSSYQSLYHLFMVNCSLTKINSDMFRNLNELSHLNLTNNLLKSLAPNTFELLPYLIELNIKGNLITTLNRDTFTAMRNLKTVDVSVNNIRVVKSDTFSNMTSLNIIKINQNRADMFLEAGAFSVGWISTIDLSNSNIRHISSNIFNTSVEHINLNDNPIESVYFNTSFGPRDISLSLTGELNNRSFESLNNLHTLTITNSTVSIMRNGSFKSLYGLCSLYVKESTVKDVEQCALCGLFKLEHFEAKIIFSKIGVIKSLAFKDLFSLSYLDLSRIGLREIQERSFFGMKKLQTLNLGSNNLFSLSARAFEGLDTLQSLSLDNSSIMYCSLDSFYGLKNLEQLNLENNKMRKIELGVFQPLSSLKILNLAGNKLTEFKVGTFSNLGKLEQLHIARNKILTILIESILPLHSLNYLDLEENNLKNLDYASLSKGLPHLKTVKIAKNKFKCDSLKLMIISFLSHNIDYSTNNNEYYSDNIDGIDCVDVCKYILCPKDTHDII